MSHAEPCPRARESGPAPVFAALGDATRLELVARLSSGQPRSIVQLRDGLNLTRQGVTKHLRVLEQAGLVSSIRVGRESRFTFKPDPLGRAQSYLESVSMQWDDALSRLKRFVETDRTRSGDGDLGDEGRAQEGDAHRDGSRGRGRMPRR